MIPAAITITRTVTISMILHFISITPSLPKQRDTNLAPTVGEKINRPQGGEEKNVKIAAMRWMSNLPTPSKHLLCLKQRC